MTPTEKKVVEALKMPLAAISPVIEEAVMLTKSTPFTYSFLAFINFFTLSSHYALLNMPLPRQLY